MRHWVLTMKLLITLVGLLLILEGLPYAAFPEAVQKWLRQVSEFAPHLLRLFGIAAVLIGLIICYITQRLLP